MNDQNVKNQTKMRLVQFSSINDAIAAFRFQLGNTDDLIEKKVKLDEGEASCLYIDSLIDQNRLEEFLFEVMNSLWQVGEFIETAAIKKENHQKTIAELSYCLPAGEVLLLIKSNNGWEIFTLTVPAMISRAIQEPKNEQIVRGSHEGFNELMSTNLYLIRKRIHSPHLVVRYFTIGGVTGSKVALVYLDHLANPLIVEEMIMRLESIDTDMSFSVGYLEEFIEDETWSPFPQLLSTERPDRVEGNLMEGRLAILQEGSPTSLVAPVNFFTFYQSPDDYNGRFYTGTFYRMLRLLSFAISLVLPALYIAIVSFHFEVIPGDLALPAKQAVEDIPYRPLLEALILELTIELIREAGIRLPNPIGQTIGIVGGLVIGDAVVNAGLISNLMIIVVALTAIASFVVPSVEMNTTVRILRFPFMLLASLFGFYGVAIGFLILVIHLIKLESLRTPYLSPLAPFHVRGVKDMFFRFPTFMQTTRPHDGGTRNSKRQGNHNRWWKRARQK